MTKDLLKERERGFEAEYFQKQDAKLIQKIRERAQLHDLALALAEKLRIDNPALLERVLAHGLTTETGAAILMVPLVQVAWADGDVSAYERRVILELAAERGIASGTPPYDQLLTWLQTRPADDLFDTALEAMRVGFAVLPAAESEERIRGVLDACERVAQVSGGLAKVLGLSSGTSAAEAAVLDAFKRKLGHSGSSS